MKDRLWWHFRIFFTYVFLVLVLTWPVAGNLTQAVAGTGGDPWQTLWRFENKLADFDFAREFLGQGEPRLVNLSVWPWMGFQVLFGQPIGYNIVWLLSFVLAGYGMFLLARELMGRDSAKASFVAGVVYAFLPYRLAHAHGHFGAMQTGWLPFILWALIVWWRSRKIYWLFFAALLIVVQAWSEHHYFLWLVVLGLLGFVYAWGKLGKRQLFTHVRSAISPINIGIALLTVLFVLIPYWPTVRLALQPSNSLELGVEQTIRFSADLFAYVTPPPWHLIAGRVTERLYDEGRGGFTGNFIESTQYLSLAVILLFLFFGDKTPKRQRAWWLFVGTLFLIVSFGPRLHVLGRVLPVPLPYALFDGLPVFSSVRAVGRAGVFVGLSSVVLFGWALRTYVKRSGLYVFILGLVLLDVVLFGFPTQGVVLSPAYTDVAKVSGRSILEVPAATNYSVGSRALWASNFHQKEVIGNIALERALAEDDLEVARSAPSLRQLLYLRTTHIRERRREFFGQDLLETFRDVVHWQDIGAVVVHTDSLSSLQSATIDTFLAEVGVSGREFGDLRFYDLAGVSLGDGVFMLRDGSWENVMTDPEDILPRAEVLSLSTATIVNLGRDERVVTLSFFVEGAHNFTISTSTGHESIYAADADRQYQVTLNFSPGETDVFFENKSSEVLVLLDSRMSVEP